MPRLDLFAHSANPSPQQLVDVCDQLYAQIQGKPNMVKASEVSKTMVVNDIEDLLGSAEHLAEQILGHYQSLPVIAEALAHLAKPNHKLPSSVLYVFLYACVREHASLRRMLDEVWSLYSDGKDRLAVNAIKGMLQATGVMMVPRPTLWDITDGRMKYEPAAFQLMHHRSFTTEVTGRFKMGVLGVAGILQDYAHMSEDSRQLMDAELAKRVYRSLMREDDPVRVLLQDKLDPAHDGQERLHRLFNCPMNGEEDDNSKVFYDHAFDLIDRLTGEQIRPVLRQAEIELDFMLRDDDGQTFIECYEIAIPLLSQTLSKLHNKGLDILKPVGKFLKQAVCPALIVEMVSLSLATDKQDLTSDRAIIIATLMAVPEDKLFSFDLETKALTNLMKIRGVSPGIRERLMSTREGQEALLGADLGV